MTGSLVSPYCFAEFHSVHAWHHPVAYNECHFVFFQFIQCFYTVFCGKYAVFISQTTRKEIQHFLIIIHNH